MTTLAQTSEVSLSLLPALYFAGRVAFFMKGRDVDHNHMAYCYHWKPCFNAIEFGKLEHARIVAMSEAKCAEPVMIPVATPPACSTSLLAHNLAEQARYPWQTRDAGLRALKP